MFPVWGQRVGWRTGVVVAAAVVLGFSGAGGARGSVVASARTWGRPQTLYPIAKYAFSPLLAVNESGNALAAWFTGAPEKVYSYAPDSRRGRRGAAAAWKGFRVVADVGSTASGFERPVVLGGHATSWSDGEGTSGIHAALSGSGVGYVAWKALSGGWMVATERHHRFGSPRSVKIGSEGRLLTLASAPRGPVDAVWYTYGGSAGPTLYYAKLRPDGGLGRPATVADLGSPVVWIDFAVNDHGAAVAAWLRPSQDPGLSGPGAESGIRAVRCSAIGRCGATQLLSFPQSNFSLVSGMSTTLDDDGTATVLADAGVPAVGSGPGSEQQLGLWGAVSRHRGSFQTTPRISATGLRPVATAVGRGGVVAMFNVGYPPIDSFAWSSLDASRARFAPAAQLPDHQTDYSPTLAGNLRGSFVAAWFDVTRPDSPYSIHASLGTAAGLMPAQTVVPEAEPIAGDSLEAGIDGHGNAVLLWPGWHGDSDHGVFAAFHHT